MNEDKIDIELICSAMMDIDKLIKLISNSVKEENESLLNHLAASHIHNALFMRNLYGFIEGFDYVDSEHEKEFLRKCGCKNIEIKTWIDIKDKLPLYKQCILVLLNDGCVAGAVYRGEYEKDVHVFRIDMIKEDVKCKIGEYITHWSVLPEMIT